MLTNGKIKKINSLKSKKTRQISQLFTIEGIKSVKEIALGGQISLREVFATEEFFSLARAVCSCPVECVTQAQIERISAQSTPEGVLAVCEIPQWGEPDFSPGRVVLALDGVRDPGNLGTIVRDVVCSPDTVDLYNPKTVQATMGSIARVRVHYRDLPALLADCPLPVYGTFLEGDDVFRAGCAAEGVIVIGNEANGISAAVARVVGRRLTIPRFAGAQGPESLNAAIAAAIVTAQLCAGSRGGENAGK